MNDLTKELKVLVENLSSSSFIDQRNELALRDQIVGSILETLGWGTINPEEVQRSVSIIDSITEYSLIKSGQKILFVKVGKLSNYREQREAMHQVVEHCFTEGTTFGVLTNGILWVLVRAFKEADAVTGQVVWTADLENEELSFVSRKISTISKQDVEQLELVADKVQALYQVWYSLLDKPALMIRNFLRIMKPNITQGYPTFHFEDAEIQDFLRERIQEIARVSSEGGGMAGTIYLKPTPAESRGELLPREWPRQPPHMDMPWLPPRR
ncbi:MAG: hypothetical protein JSW38_10260 [Dehalococcoidia bacterium]|nr:MAG: hypothetical protein JSW38_10260 [Dehalococcoidia bacterium]